MKTYTYEITKYGYKVFCDGACIRWAETSHKSRKYDRGIDRINFIKAAQATIHCLQVMDKYDMKEKENRN